MNNVVRFPNRRSEPCPICEAWSSDWQERLLNGEIPLRGALCDDCLLLFWEHVMAGELTTPPR